MMFKVGREKRDSYDYRYHYLKHNKGIFGNFYVCSQCYKILEKDSMEVDHIVPNSKWYAPNRVFNCTSICPKCNKEKSNKMGKYLVKGIVFKLIEEIILLMSFVISLALKLICYSLIYLYESLVKSLSQKSFLVKMLSVSGLLCFGYFLIGLFK